MTQRVKCWDCLTRPNCHRTLLPRRKRNCLRKLLLAFVLGKIVSGHPHTPLAPFRETNRKRIGNELSRQIQKHPTSTKQPQQITLAPWSPLSFDHFTLPPPPLWLPNKKQGATMYVPRRFFAKTARSPHTIPSPRSLSRPNLIPPAKAWPACKKHCPSVPSLADRVDLCPAAA
jgi:hypothetical protein